MGKVYTGKLPEKEAKTKTVTELLIQIADEICDNCCKWPGYCMEQRKDEDEAETMLYQEYCASCPLSRL